MSSKKEEERNEKIIRGLMKLPPNRRCINCNSVGPQYVCTNFWTFVCLSCSGIHREFTHRVKSVSMAKFTKQEVEALQQGGNQRARDIYLKNWDMTRMRLPDSSNADKIRDFIRSVYVNKKYAGERSSENTSKESESIRANEIELKRPNSYHSFSQSPPYDYQYEERRYGKNSALAPKRLASEKGYEGKVPSFLFSPGRARERAMFEDRFANESSGSRHSDFSVSSGGDQFRYDAQSPTSQKSFPSPNAAYQSNRNLNARPQRTASSSSIGSLDSNSIPESISTSDQPPVQQIISSPTSQRPPLSSNPTLIKSSVSSHHLPQQTAPDTSIDLFAGFNEHNNVTSPSTQSASLNPAAISLNLPIQQPAASNPSVTSIDLFAGFNEHNTAGLNRTVSDGMAVISSSTQSASLNPPTQQPSVTSVDLFAGFNEQNTKGFDQKTAASNPSDTSIDLFSGFNEKNSTAYTDPAPTETVPASSSVDLFAGFNSNPSLEAKDHGWANFGFSQQKQVVNNKSSGNDLMRGMQPVIGQITVKNADNVQQDLQRVAKALPVNQERFQAWNAFGEVSSSGMYATNTQMQMQMPLPQVAPVPNAQLPLQTNMSAVPAQPQPLDHWFANPIGANVPPYQGISQDLESSIPNHTNIPTNVMGPMPSQHQQLQGVPYQATQSTNPFDFLDDSDPPSNTFMDMSSIQAALPAQQPAADYYSSGTFHSEQHYTQNPIPTYPSHFSQGDMQQMSDQVLNAQIPNPSPQGYQSLGSNPFA